MVFNETRQGFEKQPVHLLLTRGGECYTYSHNGGYKYLHVRFGKQLLKYILDLRDLHLSTHRARNRECKTRICADFAECRLLTKENGRSRTANAVGRCRLCARTTACWSRAAAIHPHPACNKRQSISPATASSLFREPFTKIREQN